MPEFAPCPYCSCRHADRVIWTWWGGFILPPLFTHVKCQQCGVQYNGNTGQMNTNAIIGSMVVSFALGVGAILFVRSLDSMLMNFEERPAEAKVDPGNTSSWFEDDGFDYDE